MLNFPIPLPEGPLRDSIFDLADQCDYPLEEIYIVKASERTAHSYHYFGASRICLSDNLLRSYLIDHPQEMRTIHPRYGQVFPLLRGENPFMR